LVAVGMITRGYQSAATSYVAVFEYSFLVTASVWAWTLWGEPPDAASVAGMLLIVASGTIITTAAPTPDPGPLRSR
ncbi:MAG: hypothetical protein ACRDRK_14070, partial [Pseudonocardia sp.]